MFTKLLQCLEDASHPLLGSILRGSKIWGMWQSNKRSSRIIYNVVHSSAILFVFSQYVELWIIWYNLEKALRNLSLTMLSTVCVVKASTFVLWQKNWKTIINYVSTLERRQILMKDNVTKRIMRDYTKYSRTIVYFYWSLVTITVFTVILAPLASVISSKGNMVFIKNGSVPYPEIFSSWTPFHKTRGYGYWILISEHSLICFYGGGIVANYDSNAVVLIIFFAGQLKLLEFNCASIAQMLNSLLPPVMFLYIIICSLMICASAVQLTTDGVTGMQQIWVTEYLIALIAQLFLYCWHSNKVLYLSTQVADGVYASTWWVQNIRERRCVALLAGQLRRPVATAGPFTDLTLATFVTILKLSYSYYTLLSKKDD